MGHRVATKLFLKLNPVLAMLFTPSGCTSLSHPFLLVLSLLGFMLFDNFIGECLSLTLHKVS